MEINSDVKNIKIKTLTNQIYPFTIDTNVKHNIIQIKIIDLKKKIFEVSNVPIEKQRLVYMGKLLADDQPLNFYGKNQLNLVK